MKVRSTDRTEEIIDIQDEIRWNKRKQGELRSLQDEIIALRKSLNESYERRMAKWRGSDFSRVSAEMQEEREMIYNEVIRDLQDGIDALEKELRNLRSDDRNEE